MESVGLPVLVMEIEGTTFYNCSHCVLHRGLICPIYCLAQVEKLEVKNELFFLCSVVSQLMPQGYSVCLTHVNIYISLSPFLSIVSTMDVVGDQTSHRDELPPHFPWLRFRG